MASVLVELDEDSDLKEFYEKVGLHRECYAFNQVCDKYKKPCVRFILRNDHEVIATTVAIPYTLMNGVNVYLIVDSFVHPDKRGGIYFKKIMISMEKYFENKECIIYGFPNSNIANYWARASNWILERKVKIKINLFKFIPTNPKLFVSKVGLRISYLMAPDSHPNKFCWLSCQPILSEDSSVLSRFLTFDTDLTFAYKAYNFRKNEKESIDILKSMRFSCWDLKNESER